MSPLPSPTPPIRTVQRAVRPRAARRSRTIAIRLLMLASLLLCTGTGHALDPQRSLRELYHTAWTDRDGAPGEIFTMAQSADGYLWLGTPTGLFRFDGVQFEALPAITAAALASNDIYSLLATPDGGLWIGLGRHGVARLRDGRLDAYGEDQGVPDSPVHAMARSADGAVWAATARALLHFDGKTWTRVAGLPAGGVQSVYADRSGRVWTASQDRIFMRVPGAEGFTDTGIEVGSVAQFAEAGDGAIWIAETSNAVRPVWVPGADQRPPPTQIRVGSNALAFDRDGALWVTTLGDGLRRSGDPAAIRGRRVAQFGREVEAYGEKDGLSADFTYSIVEDREGNVWVGSSRGLDRFRAGAIVPVALPSGYHALQLVAGERAGVWIGSASRPLAQVDAHGAFRDTGQPVGLNAGYRDADGGYWWSAEPDIVHVDARGETRLRLPEAAAASRLQWLARDGAGRLWIGTARAGVFVRGHGAWRAVGAAEGLPADSVPVAYADRDGRIWLGYGRDRVSVFTDARGRAYGPHDGLAVGDLRVIGGGRRIWVGGSTGVAQWTPQGFRMLRVAHGAPRNVTGLVEADDGALWIADADGIARAAAADLERAAREPAYAVPLRRFDHLDGLPGAIQQASIHPAALRADDGRLWFATLNGLAWLDPRNMPRNPLAPQVLIRRLRGGAIEHAPDEGLRLDAGTRELRIDYTATSLGMPERVRFRYRLDGVDAGWQDAGTRRQAFYTNLAPGSYRFHVIAANADGVWSPAGAALSFSIAPAFYQTAGFYVLCALLAALALWSLHRLRLRQITGRLEQLHQERLIERERIARELHDTLLQSVQGLILRFHAAVSRLPAQDAARGALIDTLERANDTLEEGRDQILKLRDSGEAQDLAAALTELAHGLALEAPPTAVPHFELQAGGTPRALQPLVYEELFRIGGEALRNAFRHAGATRIELQLDYGRRELRLCIHDDGCGIDTAVLRAGRRDGHWGLVGMRERAARLKARWKLESTAGAGTCVEITLPASRAYRRG